MLSTIGFYAKKATLHSSQNIWPIGQKGIFVKFYPIYLFILCFFYRIFHLFLSPLNKLSISFHAKMVTLHSGRNSWPVGTRNIFVQILHDFFFHRIFHFFLGPVNMLSASFGEKMMTLYSSQNTWLVGQKGISYKFYLSLFYLSYFLFYFILFL